MDKYTRRGSDGSVDFAASANAHARALSEWASLNEVPSETIENAVEAVFDRSPEKLSMPALVGFTLTELGVDANSFKSLQTRVQAYIKGQKDLKRIVVVKGPTGGVTRAARPGEAIPAPVAKSA